jgi:hypothetical protein
MYLGQPSIGNSIIYDGYKFIDSNYNHGIDITKPPFYATTKIGTTTATTTAGSNIVTLASASDFADHESIVIYGAGADHGMLIPTAPIVTVQGTPGSTRYDYKIVACTSEDGYTAASDGCTILNGPATRNSTNYNTITFDGYINDGYVNNAHWYLIYCRKGGTGDYKYRGAIFAKAYNIDNKTELQPFIPIFHDKVETNYSISELPMTAPATSRANLLRTRVVSGGGTTILTLLDYAKSNATSSYTSHCNVLPLLDVLNYMTPKSGDYYSGGRQIYFPSSGNRINSAYRFTGNAEITSSISILGECGVWYNTPGTVFQFVDGFGMVAGLGTRWCPGKLYKPGEFITGNYPENFDKYKCIVGGISGTTEPTWSGTNVVDNEVTWTKAIPYGQIVAKHFTISTYSSKSRPPNNTNVWKDVRITRSGSNADIWSALTSYSLNDYVAPTVDNGFIYLVSVAGTSGSTEPVWTLKIGNTITDGGVTYTAVECEYYSGAGFLNTGNSTLLEDIHIAAFKGNGIVINGLQQMNLNADNVTLTRCRSSSNIGHGFVLVGADANACLIQKCDATANIGCGFFDDSFLGNTYLMCHAASNDYGYWNTGSSQYGQTYVGCYSESDNLNIIKYPAVAVGGNWGGGFGDNSALTLQSYGIQNALTYSAGGKYKFYLSDRNSYFAWRITETDDSGDIWFNRIDNDASLYSYAKGRWVFNKGGSYTPFNVMMEMSDKITGRGNFSAFPNGILIRNQESVQNTCERKIGFIENIIPTKYGNNQGDLFFTSTSNNNIALRARRRGYPTIASIWTPLTPVLIGNIRYGASGNIGTIICIQSGTTGSTEPVWTTTIGSEYTDGTAKWEIWQYPHQSCDFESIAHPSEKPGTNLTNDDQTIQVTEGSWRIQETVLTANRIKTLGTTGAYQGDQITITRTESSAYSLNIIDGYTSTSLITIPASTKGWARSQFDGQKWILRNWNIFSNIDSTAPVNGESLLWSSSTNNWAPSPKYIKTTIDGYTALSDSSLNIEQLILVNTASTNWGDGYDITLPSSPTTNSVITIKDKGGQAVSKTIDILGNGYNIDGISSNTINTNYGCRKLFFDGLEWLII